MAETSREDCFVCKMVVMEQDLLTAGAMDWDFVLAICRRLKTACEAYGHSESDRVKSSACTLHRGKEVDLTQALWKVVDLLMESFEASNQRDGRLAAGLLRLAYYFTDRYKTVLHLSSIMWEGIISNSEMLSVSEFRHLMKVAYSAQQQRPSADDRAEWADEQHIVWFAIKKRKEELLSGLLRYGVMFLPATHLMRIYFGEITEALERLDGHARTAITQTSRDAALDIFQRELRWPPHRVSIVVMVMHILSLEVCESRNVMKPEEAESEDGPSGEKSSRLEGSGVDYPSVYFQCLRRAFDTIPEPFVTSEELRRVSQVGCGDIDEETEARIDGALANFKKWYPEGAGPLAPRTLQHLSRCQVRQNLRQTGALPHGIRHLVLPNDIRKYITLDE